MIRQRYFLARKARFLLFDGEYTYKTIPYRRRKPRFATIFWTRPRFFRIGAAYALVLRGYNVTAPEVRRRRCRRKHVGQSALNLKTQMQVWRAAKPVVEGAWF